MENQYQELNRAPESNTIPISRDLIDANKLFVDSLYQPVDKNIPHINSPQYLYFREVNGTIYEHTKDFNARIGFPGNSGEIYPKVFAQQIIGSILACKPDDTILLLLAERFLFRDSREVSTEVRQICEQINTNGQLNNVVVQLRSFVKSLIPETDYRFVVDIDYGHIESLDNSQKQRKTHASKNMLLWFSGQTNNPHFDTDLNTEIALPTPQTFILCSPSPDPGNFDNCEDRGGIIDTPKNIVLVEADGVSSSFMGAYSAQEAVKTVVKRGDQDLENNLKLASTRLQNYHHEMTIPETDIPVLQSILKDRRNKGGSQTMFNQISIDKKTGQVSGLFCGDGGFSVIRQNGELIHKMCGSKDSSSRLSTLRGQLGNSTRLTPSIYLQEGDTIILYSDGVSPNDLPSIIEKIKNKHTHEAQQAIHDMPISDDKVIIGYIHRNS